MKTTGMRFICATLAPVLLCAALNGAPQDRRTLATRIADILAQYPASGSAHRDRLADEILSLGEAGIAEITRQLVAAGAGNDTAARFAVNSVAVFASQFGSEPKRALAEKALIVALAAGADPEVKTFLLSQLRLVGREPAVAAAAPYLTDATLAEPAAQFMISNRSAAARQALLAALGRAADAPQVTIVKALGELQGMEAQRAILPLASAPGVPLRKAALAALASIAGAESYGALTGAARKAGYRYDAANATGALVAYARNLGDKGDIALCQKVCRLLMKNCKDAGQLPAGSAALGILADVFGYEALPSLLRAVDHKDKAYRNAALNFAEPVGGVAATRQWVAKAQKAAPEPRAEIIGMLGRRGDARALPFLESSLQAAESQVSLAAAESIARMKKADAAADLLPMLKTRQGDDARRVAGILLGILDEPHLDPLVAMLDTLDPAPKAAAIGIIAAKGAKRYFEKIFALTSDANAEIKLAAYAALKSLAGARDLPVLLRLLDATSEPALLKEVQQALVKSANQASPAQARARPLLEAMKTSPRAAADPGSAAAGRRGGSPARRDGTVRPGRPGPEGHCVSLPGAVAGPRCGPEAVRHMRRRRRQVSRRSIQRLHAPDQFFDPARRPEAAPVPQNSAVRFPDRRAPVSHPRPGTPEDLPELSGRVAIPRRFPSWPTMRPAPPCGLRSLPHREAATACPARSCVTCCKRRCRC